MASKKQLTGKHQYVEFKEETVAKRVQDIKQRRDAMDITDRHIKLSYGNRKTGSLVPSISLAPVLDCRNCAACAKGCYAVRNIMCYSASREMAANNSAIWHKEPYRYISEVASAVRFLRFFRWHIGGDIPDETYFRCMVHIAEDTPGCQFLVFTKMYDLVNGWIRRNGAIPENLHVIFSDWPGAEFVNPHFLPVSSPLWPDGTKGPHCTENTIMCGGDCSACAETSSGCWGAKKGDTILFEAH